MLILAPDDCCGMETLTKDKSALDKMYHKGYRDAKKIPQKTVRSGHSSRSFILVKLKSMTGSFGNVDMGGLLSVI